MFGHLPELKIGDLTISQTGAIMRYLARKHGLYGNDDTERAQMDMVWELYADLFTDMGRMLYAGEKHVSILILLRLIIKDLAIDRTIFPSQTVIFLKKITNSIVLFSHKECIENTVCLD